MNKNYQISAIVPFLNEEKYLYESVNRLIEIDLFEKIVLVDDGSTDKSYKIAQSLSEKYNFIEVVKLTKSTGKGNAIRVGLEHINSSHLIIHDADLEYFPSDIPAMFEVAKNNPESLILASRTLQGKMRTNRYKITYFANKALQLFSLINFVKISDVATCYWLIETQVLKKIDIKEKDLLLKLKSYLNL